MSLPTRLAAFLEGISHLAALALCLVMMVVIGVLDIVSGGAIVLSIFYAVPISLATWVFGRRAGLLVALLATILWAVSDKYSLGQTWTSPVPWWNACVRLAFFALIVVILSALRTALTSEQRLARIDPLTRVPNVRQLRELADLELRRAERTGAPLSLASFDVDDLKVVNDRYGHAAGDELLVAVAAAWVRALRRTDVIARLGGDEFAILMPDTDEAAARTALEAGRTAALAAIAAGGWPASLSIGSITCRGGGEDVEALLRYADSLMYEVKAAGKDGLRTGVIGTTLRPHVRATHPGPGRMAST